MPDVFISYSRRDKAFVEQLNEALSGHGKDAWVDWEDIPASAEWLREIQDGIDASDAFLFVLSPDSVSSMVCGQELDHAIDRRKRILPIVHRDVDPAAVRPEAAAINWVYLRDQDSFEQGLETLVKALDTDLEHVRAHTRLANEAIDWERSGKDRARQLRGSELQEAERWLTQAAAKQPPATELQAQFVQASREAARRRGRVLFGGVAFALVVAVALAVVALIQRSNAIHQSHVAYARQLDAEAQNQYTSDPELGLLLATQAARVDASSDTGNALRQALSQSHVRDRYTNPQGPIGNALWSPDGTRLLIAEEDAGRAEIVRPGTHAKPIVLRAPRLDTQIDWDARGRFAITGGPFPSVWNGRTGARVSRLETKAVAAQLSPDGAKAATVDVGGVLHVWDVRTGRQLAQGTPAVQGAAGCLKWSPDGSKIAECNIRASVKRLGGKPGDIPETLTLFDPSGRRLAVVHEPSLIFQVAFSPDGRLIALATTTGDRGQGPGVFVLNARSGALVLTRPGAASAVAFSPDGGELAYSNLRGNIAHVYTFKDHNDVPLVGNTGSINSIAFSHLSSFVVTGADDNTARVFNSFFGTPVEVLYGHAEGVTNATFNLDDSLIATASNDGTARVWTTPVPHALTHHLLTKGQQDVSLSPDGARALVAGPASPTALVLDARTLTDRTTLGPPAGQVFASGGFSPDGRWMGTLSGRAIPETSTLPGQFGAVPEQFEIYDARTVRLSATIGSASSPIVYADFDRHGHVATISADGQVDAWAALNGRHERVLLPGGKPAQIVTYSPDGSKLAISHPNGSIDVVTASGTRVQTLHGPRPQPIYQSIPSSTLPVRVAFSPDGRWLASTTSSSSGTPNYVNIWNLATGKESRTLRAGHTPMVSLAFSPDGSILAAGDSAHAWLWRFPSGLALGPLKQADPSTWGAASELAGTGGVDVAFSRDGSTLTTNGDFSTQVWYVKTGESIFNLPFSLGGELSPDEQRVVADNSGVLEEFGCDLCAGGLTQLLTNARRDVTRGFTPAERAQYLKQS